MKPIPRKSAAFAAVLFGLLPVAGAQAQWYSSYPQAPANPYGVSPQQPYAVEVAPNTYVIHRAEKRRNPHVRDVESDQPAAEPRRNTHNDPALVEELAKRRSKVKVINTHTTRIVRDKPVVIEHERVVEDPPRVIERRHITEDVPGRGLIKHRREVGQEDIVIEPGGPQRETKRKHAVHDAKATKTKEVDGKRVIRAEAEVTILGPDRMSIRLFRKGHNGRDANAEVIE
jgi:hypothetical protein